MLLAGVEVGLALVAAGLVAALAVSLAVSWRGRAAFTGALVGGGLTLAGMLAWTYSTRPVLTWAVTGALALVAALRTWPWWRPARGIWRLGAFWLGAPISLFGVVSAVWVGHWGVAAERLVYAAVAVALSLLVVRVVTGAGHGRGGADAGGAVSLGIAVGLLGCLALLLAAGCRYVFTAGYHYTAQNAWGAHMTDRFWGGPLLLFHPNAIAMITVVAVARIGADDALARWQRLAVLPLGMLVLDITQSRTGFVMAGVASVAFAVRYLAHRLPGRSELLRTAAVAVLPLLVTGLAFLMSGGIGLAVKDRYAAGTTTERQPAAPTLAAAASGRTTTWRLMGSEWLRDGPVPELFGNADNTRGYVLRYPDRHDPRYAGQPELGADNALIESGRRAGIAGLVAFCAGVVLLVRRALRRGVPLWATVTVLAALACAVAEDEIVDIPATATWAVLLAVEAWLVYQVDRPPRTVAPVPDREEEPCWTT